MDLICSVIEDNEKEKPEDQTNDTEDNYQSLPKKILNRIQLLKTSNEKLRVEIDLLRRRYLQVKKRCDTLNGAIDWLDENSGTKVICKRLSSFNSSRGNTEIQQ